MPDFEPIFAVGDYEKASRNSFRTACNSIEVSGCLFNFSKAIWKCWQNYILLFIMQSPEFYGWIRSIMVLLMLPEEEIALVYRLLSEVHH